MNKDIQYNNRFLETLVTSPFSSWINLTWDLESSDGGERLTSSCQLWVEVNNSVIKRARSTGAYAALHIATLPPPGWMKEVLTEVILNLDRPLGLGSLTSPV